jgi:acetyltransferase
MALTLITEAKLRSLQGFSYYVGVGNEADLHFHEYLEFFQNDPQTDAILMYVEGMREGRKFLQQAYKTTVVKPVILLKSGRSAAGRQSAGSHTGALAGISEVARTAFQRAGIIVVEKSDQLFPVAETLSALPPINNNQVAVLADGGGHATIAADVLTDLGVRLAKLEESTRKRLKKILPAAASVQNPIDVAGGTDTNPGLFADCADILLKDHNVGGLLIVGLFGGYGIRFAESLSLMEEDAAHRMGKIVRQRKKPIVLHSLYNSEKPHSLHLLRYYNICVYDSVDVACKCIGALAEYGAFLHDYHPKTNFVFQWGAKKKQQGGQILKKVRGENRTALLETEAKRLLKRHGVPVLKETLADTVEKAVKAAAQIEGPVAMKIASPDILHKSDAGGVRLNLETEAAVRDAYAEIRENARNFNPDARIKGVLVAPMAPKGIEVIIGTKIDDQFGPVIMFGMGGIMVEIVKDVAFRVLPISERSARKMIEDIRGYPILTGARGENPYDTKAVKNLLLAVSEVIESYPDIREMDLNPVIVHHTGVSVVDARIILHSITGEEKTEDNRK